MRVSAQWGIHTAGERTASSVWRLLDLTYFSCCFPADDLQAWIKYLPTLAYPTHPPTSNCPAPFRLSNHILYI